MKNDIKKILVTEEQLSQRAAELAEAIEKDYNGEDFIAISILKGGFVFMADLIRNIKSKIQMDFMVASSYGASTTSSGHLEIKKDTSIDLKDKNVLIVEDIVDTGRTLSKLKENFLSRGAKSVKICTMLDKPSRREVEVFVDYKGFRIENEFVVGYGLDYAEKYRNLPYVGVLKEEIYG
ncbi:MAG: hypoxanthine phosphoribosyltransferase [Clostridia bacterium]|nr:hypoxanthine phosphoribosyltransferase [Clostridia bacterium]